MNRMTAIATKFLLLIEHECDRQDLGLLTKCTNCETPFPIPADWVSSDGVGRDDAAVSGAGVGFCICPKP
ncbi:hypothetical protein HCG51_27780 [Tolypothrix sp. PCC 7910]|uniref:hypothetical protein n=1 Tax=Tolypothrix sp. PCC 7910 TaxID=2099387 RepID=UPI0014278F38|nr:hypothetical protein [Tolypothrix sp. PCC 7910]QIR35287.1 hypothetical protein HCG51_27780 [Tolypothrix sp. PCC 7910]